ncbi:hypothetical protein Leryth_003829 [Lithospermum erythrorhizon]|nr:hypothetical protein Leryth_003829 [Lithospermum erythrorhizon]
MTSGEPQSQSICRPSSSSSTTMIWWSKETLAIVTGANKGIGYALVKKFACLGIRVILTARDEAKGMHAVDSLFSSLVLKVDFHILDVSNTDSIMAFASWFKTKYGVWDILVNNAAVSFNDVHENGVEHAETVITTNFYGPKLLTEVLLPMSRSSHTISRILNVSSRLGLPNASCSQFTFG